MPSRSDHWQPRISIKGQSHPVVHQIKHLLEDIRISFEWDPLQFRHDSSVYSTARRCADYIAIFESSEANPVQQ